MRAISILSVNAYITSYYAMHLSMFIITFILGPRSVPEENETPLSEIHEFCDKKLTELVLSIRWMHFILLTA
jgi:hypothetical protein